MRRPLGGSPETFWMLNIALLILVEFLTAFIDLLSDFVCKWWAPMWFWLWPQSPSLSSSLQSARPVSKIAAMPFRWRAWANMQAVRCRLYTTSCFSTMHGLNRSKQGVGTCGNSGQRELLLVEINAGECWKSIVVKIKYGNDKPAKTWFDFAGIASTAAEGILKVEIVLQTLLKTLHLTSFKDVAVKECRRFTSPVEASYSLPFLRKVFQSTNHIMVLLDPNGLANPRSAKGWHSESHRRRGWRWWRIGASGATEYETREEIFEITGH